ncbi:MAG: hypothetical protein IJ280_01170 [Bacteroidales bacterium]|nr:hypothetical protein [Bacteroidales bacterium]
MNRTIDQVSLAEAWLDDKGRLALRASLLFAPDDLISPIIIAKASILPKPPFCQHYHFADYRPFPAIIAHFQQ